MTLLFIAVLLDQDCVGETQCDGRAGAAPSRFHVPVGSVYNVVDDDPASRGEVVAFARQLLQPGAARSGEEPSRSGQQGPLRAGAPGGAPPGGEQEPDAAPARLAPAEGLQAAAPRAAEPAPAGAAASAPGREPGSRHVPWHCARLDSAKLTGNVLDNAKARFWACMCRASRLCRSD